MIKKTVMTLVLGGAVAGLLFGWDAWSYVKTCYGRVTDRVQQSVPTEFQIERARQMVADLTPVIRQSMHKIAKEEVALEQLEVKIDGRQQRAEKEQGEILQLQTDLKSGDKVFRYAGRSYSRNEVKQDLSRRFNRYTVEEETLASLKQMRDARQANLDAARQKFAAMVSAQQKLQADLTHLEARQQLVEVAQASSDFALDESQLARTKQLLTDIRTSLDVQAKLADADPDLMARIPLDSAESEEITEQVADYFGLNDHDSAETTVALK